MPTAAKSAAPSTGKVQTKTVTTVVTDPVEQTLPPPSTPLEPREDFWKYIESLTADDWKNHHVTLYRYPLGQTKPQKLGRYIKTYKAENPLVSEEQIFDEFGGSQYDALLKGPGPNGERLVLLAKHSWEMDGVAKNPWATSTTTPGAPPPSDTAAILETLLKHLQNLQTAKNPAQDPAVKESIALIQQLTAAMPKAQGITELVAGLADLKKLTGDSGGGGNNLKETLGILKEMGVIGGERKSLAQEIKDILEIADTLRGGGSATGGGGKRDFATSLIDNLPTILEKATPIAEKFADAARNNARVAELRSGHTPPPAAPPSATRPTPALVAPTTTPAATPAAEPPASRVVAAPETEPATPKIVVQPPSLDWVKARAVQLFAAGKPGDAVAEWLDSIDDQLGNFLGSMDAEKFSAFVKEDPILSQIATAPRFEEFVAEFVDYFASDGATDSTPAATK